MNRQRIQAAVAGTAIALPILLTPPIHASASELSGRGAALLILAISVYKIHRVITHLTRRRRHH